MDADEVVSRLGPLLKQYAFPIILATLGLISLGYGLISFLQPKQENDIVFEKNDSQEAVETKATAKIMVDVQGAVEKPGVYALAKDARVQDGLIAAGGMRQDANRSYVAKTINLAAKVIDGTKIYIPFENETQLTPLRPAEQSFEGQVGTGGNAININSATLTELDSLPGIGQITGQKIIDNRPYASIDDLQSKKIVSKSVFEKIKDKIAVY
ncbi:MAG: ComEA family DNA-binding protein [Candidatus Levybacteria bacterium]|nr:ComEA family DNA-binding protein [Candidatus Levybacteria bacterium]